MGMIDTVRNRIKSVFSRERTNIERATDLSVGAQPVGFDTASIYGRYGIEPLVDYLRIEQELVSRYMDYNEMCVYPELSAALECYADESCQFDILTGRTVWVESDDAFVKHVLQELIDKGLQLDEEIWGLSHELCKYGNCFSELLCTGEGVIGLNALPPETIRRYEKGKGILVGYAQDPRGVFGVTVEDVEKALSGHDPTATGMAYFEPWQILNMRLMGLQRQAPYGHSILESARWLWRRLLLLEDSALLYRLTRSPQKWLFYIDVGKLPPNQALGYLRRIKNEFTKSKFVNERGCLTGDTCVETLSGKIKTMKELADEGKETWIYSYDIKKNKVVPALASAPRKTSSNVEVWRVVLDNGAVVRCTPDHRFLLRDGTWSEAKDLKRGSSMMPFHLMRGSKGTYGYARVKHVGRGQWQFAHQMVAEEVLDPNYKEKGLVVHHLDSKTNNDPRFLELLDPRTHTLVHSDNLLPRRVMGWKRKVREDANFRFELGQRMIRNNRKWMQSTRGARKQLMEVLESKVRSNPDWSLRDYADWMNVSEDTTRLFKSLRSSTKKISKETIFQWIKSCGYTGVHDFKNDCVRKPRKSKKLVKVENHKVVEVCFDGYADVYDLTIDGTENFALTAGIFAHNSLDMRYSPLASDENLFLPVVDGKRTTEVELMATPEWQVMDDINYFRDKLFTAIRIPKAYLAAEEVSRSRTLSLEDVRFARSIMRIQRELKNGIKRLCKVHLAAMNVDPEKVNFEVFMTVPSWAYEMAQIEVRSARADFAEKVGDHLSERAILRLVFGFSDEEINALRKERKEEMREAAEAEGGGGAEPEKKAPAKTEGSIMDLPRLSRVSAKDEEKEDKNMRILKEKMDEMLGQNKGIAESLDQSKDFMKNLKTSIMFQPYRGQQRVVKSLGMGPRRNA